MSLSSRLFGKDPATVAAPAPGIDEGPRPALDAKYWAFISYSHRDTVWANWLHKSLESYRPPKDLVGTSTPRGPVPKRLTPVFRDREELPSATDLGALLNAALQQSRSQIIICSPKSAKSHWVNEEVLAFKRLGREDRIFCLIVGGEPNASDMPGREDEECFPPALRFKLGPDGNLSNVRTEPIAADARPGKDGKSNAKLKLIAGLLGVGFDALRRREQQRRNRSLLIVACGAMAGMVVTSGLAAYALFQRAAAQRETVRAEAETKTAKETTKFLVDLFKISDPSEARGNTVTAREMLDKGAQRVDRELAGQPAIQATLMDTLGSVYTGLGLYGEARSLLERAVAKRRTLPGDPLVLPDSLSHLGDVQVIQAKYGDAEKSFQEAIRLESARPKDRASQIELATSLHGYGVLLTAAGKYADAAVKFRDALGLQRTLYGESNPDVARTLKDLGTALAYGGDLNAAIPLLRKAVELNLKLYGSDPHPDTAESLNDLALQLWQQGDYDGAEKNFVASLAMYRKLLGEKHIDVANLLLNLASTLQDKGDLERAEATYRESLAISRELLGDAHPAVAQTLHNLASVQYDRGNTQEAIATEREAIAAYRKVYPQGHKLLALALNVMGFWLTMAGQYEEADRDLNEGLAMRRRVLGESHPDVASSLMMLAHLEVAERRYSEALDSAHSAAEIYTAALSSTHWRTAIAESAEGAALTGLDRYADAEALLNKSYGILKKDQGAPRSFQALTEKYLETLHRRERGGGDAPSSLASARTVKGESSATTPPRAVASN
jgi:tetratricopeptide (TPR) repeat protein